MSVQWLAELRGSTEAIYRIGREGEVRVAEWPGFLTIRCGPDGTTDIVAAEGADPLRLTKVKNGLVKALVDSLSGALTLHASAIAANGRAVLCLGASGMGKSTLAEAMCARDGVRLLADDMTPVRVVPDATPGGRTSSFLALPCERTVWVRASDQERKVSRSVPFAEEASPVVAIVALSFVRAGVTAAPLQLREVTELRRLTPAELFARLVPQVVRFKLDDPVALEGELMQLGRLSRSIPAYELLRPRDIGRLEEAAELLASLLEKG